MSITNAKFPISNNRNEKTFNRLKTISKSININNNLYNNDNNPNIQYKELYSIFNYNKNYKNIGSQSSNNTHSIENIFNRNERIKNNDSPIKIYFNKDNIFKNNLNTIDYSSTNEIKLERKISSKSIKSNKNNYSPNKSANIYKNDSLIFEPFSPKRILTIPTQKNHYGYAIDDNGESELLDDPKFNEKFNGTKSNSVGPGQYNIVISPRKRLIIDWSKLSEESLLILNHKRKIKNKKELGELNKLDGLYLSTKIINENKNHLNDNYSIFMDQKNKSKSITNLDLSNFKNKIFRNNNIKLKDYKSDDSYINLTSLNYIKQKKEDQTMPGPGSYNYSDEFLINPKKNKFQNFGSSVSRDLLIYSPKKKKNNPFDNFIKYSFFSDKNIKDKINKDKSESIKKGKSIFFNNPLNASQKLKIKTLKENNIQYKKEQSKKLGPGKYYSDIHKLKSSNGIENFGTLEKRKLTTVSVDTPGVGSYIPLEDWTKKYNNNFKTIETEINEEKYKLYREKQFDSNLHKDEEKKEIKNENIIENDPYYNKSIDYDNRINVIKNRKRPGFGSREPRFHIFSSQINELNGVGKYNLFPLKKQNQQFSPFIYSSSRNNIIKSDNNVNLGPGTYNKYDTFLEWNKKTYNIKVKNKIDKYKILKN